VMPSTMSKSANSSVVVAVKNGSSLNVIMVPSKCTEPLWARSRISGAADNVLEQGYFPGFSGGSAPFLEPARCKNIKAPTAPTTRTMMIRVSSPNDMHDSRLLHTQAKTIRAFTNHTV